MKKNNVSPRGKHLSKINPNAEHIAELDDYELPDEFPLDPRKMKPNPYAGHVKFARTRVRSGAESKRRGESGGQYTITLSKSQAKFLFGLDRNLSSAIRKLIAKAK